MSEIGLISVRNRFGSLPLCFWNNACDIRHRIFDLGINHVYQPAIYFIPMCSCLSKYCSKFSWDSDKKKVGVKKKCQNPIKNG